MSRASDKQMKRNESIVYRGSAIRVSVHTLDRAWLATKDERMRSKKCERLGPKTHLWCIDRWSLWCPQYRLKTSDICIISDKSTRLTGTTSVSVLTGLLCLTTYFTSLERHSSFVALPLHLYSKWRGGLAIRRALYTMRSQSSRYRRQKTRARLPPAAAPLFW